MAVGNHMNQLPGLKPGYLGDHGQQHGVLHHIPSVGGQHILRTLVQNAVQGVSRHVKRHGVGAGVKRHLAQVVVVVEVGHNAPGCGIVLQVPEHLVHLIHIPLGVVVLHPQLIAVSLADGPSPVRPRVPHMAVQVVDIIGLFLPDPQQLIHRRLDKLLPDGKYGKLFPQIVAVDYPKQLYRVCGRTVLPAGADRPVRIPHALG